MSPGGSLWLVALVTGVLGWTALPAAASASAWPDAIRGMSQPPDRVFPGAPEPSRVIDSITLPDEAPLQDRFLVASLQGLVNRAQPRIFVVSRSVVDFSNQAGPRIDLSSRFWLDKLLLQGFVERPAPHPYALVQRYASTLRGAVVYDPAILRFAPPIRAWVPDELDQATLNLTAMLAAVHDALAVTPSQLEALRSGFGVDLPVIADTRGRWSSWGEAYGYAYDVLRPALRTDITAHVPHFYFGMLDYVIQQRVLTYHRILDPTREQEVLEDRILGAAPNTPVIGVWALDRDEGNLVRRVTEHGRFFTVMHEVFNTSWTSRLPPPPMQNTPKRALRLDPSKIYVAFTMSEGDNLSYLHTSLPGPQRWERRSRLAQPVGFEMNITAFELMPNVMDYYYRTLGSDFDPLSGPARSPWSTGDVAGPGLETHPSSIIAPVSGAGYVTGLPPQGTRAGFFELTSRYMQLTGTRIVRTFWNDRGEVPEYTRIPAAEGVIVGYADGGTAAEYTRANSIVRGKPVMESFRWELQADAVASMTRRPAFVNFGVPSWLLDTDSIRGWTSRRSSDFVFVTPDEMAALFEQYAAQCGGCLRTERDGAVKGAFADAFDDGDADGWVPGAGAWSARDGRYEQADAGARPAFTTVQGARFRSGVYEADVRIESDRGAAGLWLRRSPADSGFAAMLAADGRLTLRNDGKVLAEVGTGLAPVTGPVHLAVHAQGPRLRVYAGNTSRPQIDLADASWEGGSFGLITEGAAATFDHAEVSFLDAFDGAAAWTQNAGDWAVEDGTFSQSGPTGPVGDVAVNDTLYDDAVYEADVRFPGACAECWAGMAIRKHFSADSHTQSGYLVYLRPSGAVSVFKVVVPGATTGRNLPGGSNVETFVDPVAAPVHLKVEVRGTRLRVFVGETDAPQIDVRDYSMNRSSEPGYLSLKTAGGHVHFDNVSVRARDTADVALRAARRRGDRVSESIDEQANGGRLAGDLAASFSGEVAAAQEAIDAALAQYAAANGASSERVVLSAALDALSRIQGLRWTIEKERVAGAVSSETAAVLRSGLQEVAESLRLLTIRLLGIRASITAPTSVMPGESLRAAVVLENGDESALKDVAVLLEPPPGWSVIPQRAPSVAELRRGARFELPFQLRVPAAQPVARGLPIEATITLVAEGTRLDLARLRTVSVAAPLTITSLRAEPPVAPVGGTATLHVTVRNLAPGALAAAVSVSGPAAWDMEPPRQDYDAAPGAERTLSFELRPGAGALGGLFTAVASYSGIASWRARLRVFHGHYAWEFEDDGDGEGWQALQDLMGAVSGGVLSARSTGLDPILAQTLPAPIDASAGKVIELMMEASVSSPAQVFWTTEASGSFSEDKSVRFSVQGGGMRTYRIQVPPQPSPITSLRFDPLEMTGEIRIDAIRVVGAR